MRDLEKEMDGELQVQLEVQAQDRTGWDQWSMAYAMLYWEWRDCHRDWSCLLFLHWRRKQAVTADSLFFFRLISLLHQNLRSLFSERELVFTFAICRRLSVCRLSVTFVHPTQPIEIFGNVSAPCNTLVTWRHPGKILRRSSRGNPSVGGLNQRVLEKM